MYQWAVAEKQGCPGKARQLFFSSLFAKDCCCLLRLGLLDFRRLPALVPRVDLTQGGREVAFHQVSEHPAAGLHNRLAAPISFLLNLYTYATPNAGMWAASWFV